MILKKLVMKKTRYLLISLCALAAVACNSDNIGAKYSGKDGVATFPNSILKDSEVQSKATEYYVPVRRQTSSGELTVNVAANPYSGKIKAPVTSVKFADGEFETKLKIDITDIVIGETDTLGLKLTDCTDRLSIDTCAVILARGYTWTPIGEGQWYDSFVETIITTVNVSKADGFDIYRVYSPYPKDAMEEAEYETSGAWGCGGDECDYIEFSVAADGSLSWKDWSTTIDYDGNGNTIYAMYLPDKDPKCGGEMLKDNVALFYPYYYIPGLGGGFGVAGFCALSMPGGPDLEKWLEEE